MLPRRLVLVLALVSLASFAAHAADPIEAVLARPVSPGTLAMLLEYNTDQRVVTRWVEALSNADPHVRATAARLLHVGGAAGAVPQLRSAIVAESDPAAAMEMARPLLAMGAASDDAALLEVAKRIPAPEVAIAVSQTRKHLALNSLPTFLALPVSESTAAAIVSNLVSDDPDALERVAQAALDATAASWWNAILAASVEAKHPLSAQRVLAGIASSSKEKSDATWWYAAIVTARGQPVAGLPSPRGAAAPGTVEGAFARELVARAAGSAPIPQPILESTIRSGPGLIVPPFVSPELRWSLRSMLTDSERDALGIGVSVAPRTSSAVTEPLRGDFGAIRTVSDLPAGFVTDVLKQTGCTDPDSSDIAGAVVRFDNNRLRQVQWVATALSPQCEAAARYITAASLVPEWAAAPGTREFVALPMHRAFIECLASVEPETRESGAYQVGAWPMLGHSNIKPPTKTRNVSPVYPTADQNARVQGVVILEATIGPSGCVARTRVLRDMTTGLNVSALRAVTGWAFTPTLLNGRPVPVIMTVTVQFTLK
jgi:TonB family protein